MLRVSVWPDRTLPVVAPSLCTFIVHLLRPDVSQVGFRTHRSPDPMPVPLSAGKRTHPNCDYHNSRYLYGEMAWRFIAEPTDTDIDRKSTRLNSSHVAISYAVFCLKKKRKRKQQLKRQ